MDKPNPQGGYRSIEWGWEWVEVNGRRFLAAVAKIPMPPGLHAPWCPNNARWN